MTGKKLDIAPLEPGEYAEAAAVYRESRRFRVDISSYPPESPGPELVAKEAADAREHGALFCGLRLKKSRQMVGVAVYEPSNYRGDPACAWIALLMIAEPCQGRGYGTEAAQHIEDAIFSAPGVQAIKLGVLSNNPAALAFWRRMGYREAGRGKDVDSGHDAIIREKARKKA